MSIIKCSERRKEISNFTKAYSSCRHLLKPKKSKLTVISAIFLYALKKAHSSTFRRVTTVLILCSSLFFAGCGTASNSTPPVTSSENPDLRCENIENFRNSKDFWKWAYENIPTVTAADISSGAYNDTYVCFNVLVIGAIDQDRYIELPVVEKNSSGEYERGLFIFLKDTINDGNFKYGEDVFESAERSDELKLCGKVSNASIMESNVIAIQNMGKNKDFDMNAFLKKDMEQQKQEATNQKSAEEEFTKEENSVTEAEEPLKIEDSQNDTPSQTESPSKPVPYSLEHGNLLDANPDGGANMNTLVIKAKIEPNLTNRLTITQNYLNVIQMIQKGDYTQYDAIDYWAVADMTDGSEGKVISFTVDKSCIEAIANGSIASGDTLEKNLTDLWILPSLLED